MNNQQIIVLLLVLAIAGGGAYVLWENVSTEGSLEPVAVTNFSDCAKYYAVMESYPRQCKTPDGMTFTENIGLPAQAGNELDKRDLIRITLPRPNAEVASPLRVSGEARGGWYFEASFPAELLDQNGKQLAIAPAQAKGEWMTTEFVPFEVTLTFPAQPKGSKGSLILRKDNPSGLPEHDDALIVPVIF